MKEEDNILRIFKETKRAIEQDDSFRIKHLSNETIHSAAVSQDPDNIIVAVLVYTISKIVERKHYKDMPGWQQFNKILTENWDIAIESLEKNNIKKFREAVGKIRNSLNKIDENLSDYIRNVFEKAQINKAFKIYEHGLSSQQTAELLGVSLWDLATYIGQSSISETKLHDSLPVKQRIKYAEDIFS